MPDGLFQVIYGSSETYSLNRQELHSLLRKSRANNRKRQITGALFYKDGNFLQVLEGDQIEVLSLYETIRADPRHNGVITFIQRTYSVREFEDWTMAFYDLPPEDAVLPEGYSTLLNRLLSLEDFDEYPRVFSPILRAFTR